MQSSCGARLEAVVAAEMSDLAQHALEAAGLLDNEERPSQTGSIGTHLIREPSA